TPPHCFLVLGPAPRLRAIERARALLFLGGLGPVRIHPRQIDLEARAVPELAVEPDVAAALLHHAVHGRETEARALTHRLGREKGLEDPGVGLASMPVPLSVTASMT